MFFLGLVVSVILTVQGLNDSENAQDYPPIFPWYLIGAGWGIFIIIWSFWQLGRILRGRRDSADIIDKNQQLKAESGNLFNNIQNARKAEKRLRETHETTKETTDLLKEKYKDIKKWTDSTDIISGQNSKIASQIRRKFGRMLRKLREELVLSEMGVIEALYDEIHLDDGNEGLTKDGYQKFINQMPEEYRNKFKFRMSDFMQYAGDDEILQKEELMEVLEAVVESEMDKEDVI